MGDGVQLATCVPEAEHADRDTTVPGVNVLLHAVLARANR